MLQTGDQGTLMITKYNLKFFAKKIKCMDTFDWASLNKNLIIYLDTADKKYKYYI